MLDHSTYFQNWLITRELQKLQMLLKEFKRYKMKQLLVISKQLKQQLQKFIKYE
jgi:hypothetical protein